MLHSLGGFGCLHLKFSDAHIFLNDDGFQGFFLDFPVNDFLLKNFNLCTGIDQFLFLSFVSSEQFLQTVCFGGQGFFQFLDANVWCDGPFCH